MKVCILGDISQANFEMFIMKAFAEIGWKTVLIGTGDSLAFPFNKTISKHLYGTTYIKRYYDKIYLKKLNDIAYQRVLKESPDLIITHNNAKLSRRTILKLRSELKCPVVCFAADDPTLTFLAPLYLESITAFSHIIAFDSSMISRIKQFSGIPVINLAGASSPSVYFPIKNGIKSIFKSDIGYCSASYQGTALGMYRGAILSELTEYDLKIYGDKNWDRIANTFPELKPHLFNYGFLSAEDMNILYNSVSIYLGIVNPLILCGISQRIFDCAMAGCFQIVEWKKDIENWFPNEEIETFKSIPELKEKVKYYLDNPEDRKAKSEKALKKVTSEYKWTDLVSAVLNKIQI